MNRGDSSHRLTRRELLQVLGAGAGMVVAAACAPISSPSGGSKPGGAPTVAPAPAGSTPGPASNSGATAPRKGGKLTAGHTADFVNFDPLNQAIGNYAMINQLYNVLVRYDEKLQPQPELAESWQLSADGKSLRMSLRKDVKFHDGRPMVAEDVVFSLKRLQDPKTGANGQLLAKAVTGVETPDPYTVVFNYDKPNPVPFELLQVLPIQDQKAIADTTKANGTGPFKLVEWRPGDRARFVRNEQYWRSERPYLDEIIVSVLPDHQTMTANLQAGAIDTMLAPAVTDYARLKDNPQFKSVFPPPGGQVLNILMNVTRPPFDKKEVRQAISYALNRQRVIEVAYMGIGKLHGLPFPVGSLGYDEEINKQATTFDLDKAKKLIGEAGYPNGFEATIQASAALGQDRAQAAQILQADLAKIGVKLTIENPEAAVYRQRFLKGDYQMSAHSTNQANKDPSTLFGTTFTYSPENGSTHFKSDEYSKLVEAGATTLDPAKRREIYQQVAKLLVDEAFVLVAAQQPMMETMHSYVEGVRLTHDSFQLYENAWLNK